MNRTARTRTPPYLCLFLAGLLTVQGGMASPGPEDLALLEKLLARRILLAQRFTSGVGGLRASTHFYNDDEDIGRFLEALGDLV